MKRYDKNGYDPDSGCYSSYYKAKKGADILNEDQELNTIIKNGYKTYYKFEVISIENEEEGEDKETWMIRMRPTKIKKIKEIEK